MVPGQSSIMQREVSTTDAEIAGSLMQAENGDWNFFPDAGGSSRRPFEVTLRQYVDDGVIFSRNSVVGSYQTFGGSADFGVPLLSKGTWEWESEGTRGTLRDGPMLMRPHQMFFSRHEDLEVSNVYVTPAAMNRTAAEVYGLDETQISFTSGNPISPAHGRYFASLVGHTNSAVKSGAFENDLVRAALLRNLAVGMLECFPVSGDRRTRALTAGARARVFRSAVEFMEGHASLPITINDVARAVGCSLAELDRAFVAHTMSPATPYLWKLRLQGAHGDLLAGDTLTASVAGIAARWGYPSVTAFALRYLHAYGRSPADTLAL